MRPRVVPLSSEQEARAKASVHHEAWKEAYRGLIDQAYLDARTLELSETFALRAYREGCKTLLAKVDDRVVGFADYGPYRGDDLPDAGEVYAIYLLESYYRQGIGTLLMRKALACLRQYPRVVVWVLEGNGRAISFYRSFGFEFDGSEKQLVLGNPVTEQRMVLGREVPRRPEMGA